MFVLTGTDRLNHYLWEDFEDTASPHHQAFLDYYHEVDREIGRIIERLPESTTLAAVSDHGFARQLVSVNLNCLLAQAGYLSLSKSDRPSYIDMTPESRAFAMDPGRIYLHRQGRYPRGAVTIEQADALLDEVTRFLREARIDGRPVADRVLRGSDIYSGAFAHRAPDLVVMPAENVALSGRMNLSELIEPTLINGKHTYEESTFFYRGEHADRIPDDMRVEDVLSVVKPKELALTEAA